MKDHTDTTSTTWQAALEGDRKAFNRLVEPHLTELLEAARRDIRYRRRRGELNPDQLSAEELVGETLLRAWKGRRNRPPTLSLKAWLLGLQHRVLDKLIQVDRLERDLWVVSLEDSVPPEPLFDDEESFWEWYQPDDLTRWEDVLPASSEWEDARVTMEADADALENLEPEGRMALLLHDEHEVSLAEVALITGRTVREAAALITEARQATD